MGANIDYAIVISNRYMELKKQMPPHKAIILALNQAFPTIITSGSMLAAAGLLIGFMSSDPTVASIGICLGRGTILSIFLVMFVLPEILLWETKSRTDDVCHQTAERSQELEGSVRVNGHIRGYVSGTIDAKVQGVIHGEVHAIVDTEGKKEKPKEEPTEEQTEETEREEGQNHENQ